MHTCLFALVGKNIIILSTKCRKYLNYRSSPLRLCMFSGLFHTRAAQMRNPTLVNSVDLWTLFLGAWTDRRDPALRFFSLLLHYQFPNSCINTCSLIACIGYLPFKKIKIELMTCVLYKQNMIHL